MLQNHSRQRNPLPSFISSASAFPRCCCLFCRKLRAWDCCGRIFGLHLKPLPRLSGASTGLTNYELRMGAGSRAAFVVHAIFAAGCSRSFRTTSDVGWPGNGECQRLVGLCLLLRWSKTEITTPIKGFLQSVLPEVQGRGIFEWEGKRKKIRGGGGRRGGRKKIEKNCEENRKGAEEKGWKKKEKKKYG